ncbi:MAG: dihydrolipoyl dehydrogenase [Chthonomonadales bacterium]
MSKFAITNSPAVAEPPIREAPVVGFASGLALPTREEIEQEVQQLMSPMGSFDADVVIIGSGPGGYVAAIRAAQLGARTVCIEKAASEWGGTCLNWGCIPTKTMLASVERYQHAKHADRLGIITGEVSYDFGKIMSRKDKIVTTLRGGVEALLKSNHVRKVVGVGRVSGINSVEVTAADGTKETITTKNIVVATGSEPIIPPIPGLTKADGSLADGIWTSNEAVYAKSVPARMVIIGAGAVGLEFAHVFNGLGSQCTVVEFMDEIVPLADSEVAAELRKALTKSGIKFNLSSKVTEVKKIKDGLSVTINNAKGDSQIECDVVLVGVGRKGVFANIGLEELGIEMDRRGIVVNEKMQTKVSTIYAIGDVVAGSPALAHVASHQGIIAVENATGHEAKMDYRAIPSPIFTEPEMGTVGMTEKQAKEAGYDVVVGKFPFRPLGKSMAIDVQDGMVKVVSERKYGEVLGIHIVGPHASDLVSAGVMAIQLESTLDEVVGAIWAHPTLSEAILEAAEDAKGQAIHKMRS